MIIRFAAAGFLVVASLMPFSAAPAPASPSAVALPPGSECDGVWNYITGLTCQDPCTEGCVLGAWNSPAGVGRACFCDIIGPPADCCRLVVIPNGEQGSILSKAGDCAAPGCNQGPAGCRLMVGVDPDTGKTVVAFTLCPDAP